MKNFNEQYLDLTDLEMISICGGGPILDGISWWYQTCGSFYHGVYDGLMGNKG